MCAWTQACIVALLLLHKACEPRRSRTRPRGVMKCARAHAFRVVHVSPPHLQQAFGHFDDPAYALLCGNWDLALR